VLAIEQAPVQKPMTQTFQNKMLNLINFEEFEAKKATYTLVSPLNSDRTQ
jgi:hypothetical protein